MRRRTEQIGTSPAPCDICGHVGLVLTRSSAVRAGLARLNPAWNPVERTYEVCPACGVRYRTEHGQRV